MPGVNRWNRARGRKALSDSTLTVGIKQGTGSTVPVAFGSNPRKKRSTRSKKQRRPGARPLSRACWNAFAEPHMALPRAVAPYTVIRTTAIWNPGTDDRRRFALFGPVMDVASDAGQWSNGYCISVNTAMGDLRNTTDGTTIDAFGAMTSASWRAASVTPSAFSIQVLNPEALQGSKGMVYIGRCKNKVHMAEGDNNSSFQDLADDLVSYSNPRMCSAGKLALRGVQVDAVPNNMSELAKFTSIRSFTTKNNTLASTNTLHQEGFNPIFLYNPNAVDLQVLVCCEWRVRFDPSNPAYAACKMQKPSTDSTWASHMESAVAMGNGVVDIVETVARLGRAAGYV